jgi:hypothetical protein
MTSMSRTLVGTGIVLSGMLGVVGGASAGAQSVTSSTPTPIGPKQSFVGLVNSQNANANIQVVCPGPLRSGQTGKPVSGQTVSVQSPTDLASTVGYTGGRAHSVVAEFTPASSVGATIKMMFTYYGSQPLPTSVQLPCSGTATVVFMPRPRSHSASTDRVAVTFVATCNDDDDGPCPVSDGADLLSI